MLVYTAHHRKEKQTFSFHVRLLNVLSLFFAVWYFNETKTYWKTFRKQFYTSIIWLGWLCSRQCWFSNNTGLVGGHRECEQKGRLFDLNLDPLNIPCISIWKTVWKTTHQRNVNARQTRCMIITCLWTQLQTLVTEGNSNTLKVWDILCGRC